MLRTRAHEVMGASDAGARRAVVPTTLGGTRGIPVDGRRGAGKGPKHPCFKQGGRGI